MRRVWIIGICLVLAIATGCSEEPAPEIKKEVVVIDEPEEEIEVEDVEDMDEETFKKVRFRIQEELMVFDASRFDDGLMSAVKEKVNSGMGKASAKEIVAEILDEYMDMWQREIVTETLEYLVGEYSRSDFEKLIQTTTNDQIKDMVVAYVVEKLIQEGYQFDK